MSLVWSLDGPTALKGPIFTCVGTAVAMTGGLGVAQSAAFILSNPLTSKVKLIPLRYMAMPTGVGTAAVIGCAKALLGTASLAPAGAGGGGVTIVSVGLGTGSSVGQIWGSATMVNGTAGPAANNAWVVVDQVAAIGTNGSVTGVDGIGVTQLLPGESAMVYASAGQTLQPQITWIEVALQGA